MTDAALRMLAAADLVALGRAAGARGGCSVCSALACRGWESLPGGFDAGALRRVGTLRRPGDDEPTLAEHHPDGTHGWSVDAPIAPRWFPYNRCDLWACAGCGRLFLRYTEVGGYYADERIRELDPALVVDA